MIRQKSLLTTGRDSVSPLPATPLCATIAPFSPSFAPVLLAWVAHFWLSIFRSAQKSHLIDLRLAC
jgi:hypothetical protein